MVLSHSNLARSLVPLSVPESRGGGRSNKVVERTAGRPARQKNMADSLWPGGSSWQHVAIAGNVPNEGKNYEPEICQRGSEAPSSVQATSFSSMIGVAKRSLHFGHRYVRTMKCFVTDTD